jgi:4-amino-4-deoxy-L-arabinose transferase-like glycosyltransferase
VLLILLMGFGIRIIRLDNAPLYLDEATHIMRAQRVVTDGEIYGGVVDNKALHPVILAAFQPTGPEGPFLGRMLSVFAGVISLAACMGIARALAGSRAGLLAGMIYALLPMAVFHERQALVDPLLAMFTTLSMLLVVWVARRPRVWMALLLAAALMGGYLTKVSAAMFFVLPPVGSLLLARRRSTTLRALTLCAAGMALAILGIRTFFWLAAAAGEESAQNELSVDRIRLLNLTDPQTQADLLRDFQNFADFTGKYVGWAVVAIVLCSVILVWQGRHRREVLYLWIPSVAFTAGLLIVAADLYTLPARYFMMVTAPAAALAGMVLSTVMPVRERAKAARGWIGAGALALVTFLGLRFDLLLIRDLAAVPLANGDQALYLTGLTAGYAYQQVAEDILAAWANGGQTRLNTLTYGGYDWQVSAHLGPRLGEHAALNPGREDDRLRLARWLAHDEAVYVIDTHRADLPLPANPLGAVLQPVGDYRHGAVELSLYRVAGAEGELAASIYEMRVAQPEELDSVYEGLAADLLPVSQDRTIVVFPQGHAAALSGRGVANVSPLHADRWPLEPDDAAAAVRSLGVDGQARFVDIVQVNPDTLTPGRSLSAALARIWYRTGEVWYDQVLRTTYVTGPETPDFAGHEGEWESAIRLQEVALVDAEPRRGGVIRIAVVWSTTVPIQDSYHVFTHVVDGNGTLAAQYDSRPGGGVLPMTGWEPGEPVEDRFAVMLPLNLAPGRYEVRLGIYSPEGGFRLAVTGGGTSPDFVVIGEVTVSPGS